MVEIDVLHCQKVCNQKYLLVQHLSLRHLCSDRSDDCVYIFGYGSWGLCIVRETGHRQWSGVA